jgi:tRNA/rRNA methyltransferase
LLDEAGHFDRVEGALSDAHFVLATTARPRGLTKPVLSPEEAMRQAAERIARGENVSIMFGPERSGLENEEIAQANAIVSVPVNPDFPSLNLAQCVLLLGYEWRRATQAIQAETMEMAKTEWAETGEIEKLSEHFETTLDLAGFFFPEAKAEGMKTNLRNLWSRMPLTRSDVQIFHGMMRQMVRWKNHDGD